MIILIQALYECFLRLLETIYPIKSISKLDWQFLNTGYFVSNHDMFIHRLRYSYTFKGLAPISLSLLLLKYIVGCTTISQSCRDENLDAKTNPYKRS